MREKEIDKQILLLQEQKKRLRSRRIWKCKSCGRGTQIGKLTLIGLQSYVSPYSCAGGDYWYLENEPEYNIECQKCKTLVRELISWKYNKQYKMLQSHRDDFKAFVYGYSKRYSF